MTNQCKSCGGFCGNKCERGNVGFGPPKRGITITEDEIKAIISERDGLLEIIKVAIDERDHYRRERDALRKELGQ